MSSRITARDLGIRLKARKNTEIFKWFLACLLFGKPIQQQVAKRAYGELVRAHVTTPQAIKRTGWKRLVKILDRGHYVRFDFSTATKLLAVADSLISGHGTLTNLYRRSKNKTQLRRNLMAFPGVGLVTTRIFLRDMRTIWPKAR